MKKRNTTKILWNKLGQAITITGSTGVGAALAILLAGFVPPMEGQSIRRPVAKKVAELRPEDYPAPIVHSASGTSFRASVSKKILSAKPESYVSASGMIFGKASAPSWMQFSASSLALNTAQGSKQLENTASAMALVLEDGADYVALAGQEALLVTTQPKGFGEALTSAGRPLRWQNTDTPHTEQNWEDVDPLCALERPSMEALQAKLLTRAYAPGTGESYRVAARRYAPIVRKMAQKYKLRPSLIYAIIHTESNFRPRLASSASAMGLMQLLPSTAGGEVHRYLYGHTAVVTHEDLAQPELNITFGATYFHLLMTQHLYGIVQHRTREICAIAAYNMGIGRLLRYFGPSDEAAFAAINALTPQQVFQQLTEVLPIAETRAYVSRVSYRESMYKNL